MFTDWLRRTFRGVIEPVATFFDRIGVHPNTLTLIGCLLQVSVGIVVALGAPRWGGILLAVTSVFDAFDGALARQRGQTTKFGAFLDSTLDRVSEAAVLMGLAWYFMQQPGYVEEMLAYVALVGSLMVSYTRARAEGLGYTCKEGLFTRVERTLLIVLGLISGWVRPMIWILAIGSVLTALYRMLCVYKHFGDEPLTS